MSAPVVVQQSYGKSQVRISRIHREGARHEFIDLTVWIELDGDFLPSYSAADNSQIVPTDTMKNTVYVLSSRSDVKAIEVFAQVLAKHFLDTYQQVSLATIRCEEKLWTRMAFGSKQHDHAFVGNGSERCTCSVKADRAKGTTMTSGVCGLQVLKTTGSSFVDYVKDEYTTLAPAEDRIFATAIEAHWPCSKLSADWPGIRQTIRAALLDVFANQFSKSVQHTLYEMARAAFAACELIDEITITMPNQHHLLANLTPFGLRNPNEVFVPTSEPFGNISATISRTAT
jgi:urate oxidase